MSATDSLLTVLILAAIGNTLITALVLFNVKGVRVRLAIARSGAEETNCISSISGNSLLDRSTYFRPHSRTPPAPPRGTTNDLPGPDPLEQRVQDSNLRPPPPNP
ncbi:hypothetical protein GS914_00015 [Rhodococcus hoagii]|nr:hypothetical protein [Prescottella equi]